MVKRIKWTPALVSSFWDGVAQTPLDELSFGRLAGPALLDIVTPHLRAGARHLDYGAGSGYLTRLLLERGYATAAYEPSPARERELLRQVGSTPGFLGVVDDESADIFDVVLMVEVVEHVLEEDLDNVLSRANRFLAPGGTLIVTTPNNENLEQSSVYCPMSDTLYHPWQHVRSFTPESLSELLARFGFQRTFLGTVDFSADCDIHEAFKRYPKVETAIVDVLERLMREQREFYSRMSDTGHRKQSESGLELHELRRAAIASFDEQRTKVLETLEAFVVRQEAAIAESQQSFNALLEHQGTMLTDVLEKTTALLEEQRQKHLESLRELTALLAQQQGGFTALVEASRRSADAQQHATERLVERERVLLALQREILERWTEAQRASASAKIRRLFGRDDKPPFAGLIERVAALETRLEEEIGGRAHPRI